MVIKEEVAKLINCGLVLFSNKSIGISGLQAFILSLHQAVVLLVQFTEA